MYYINRDLKPDNLMLESGDDNNIKVIDFGGSMIFQTNKSMRDMQGTVLLFKT
jgi:serine/threonine protein kinase